MTSKVKLGEICEIVSGSTPKTTIPEYWDGSLKWITPAEIHENMFTISDSVRHLTELGVEKTGLRSFPKGTVILTSRAPIGKVAIAGDEMYCNQGFKNLICSEQIVNTYLYYFLKSKTGYLNSLGRGATFKEISKAILSEVKLDLPDITEQHKISDKLRKIDDLIDMEGIRLQKYDELVKSRFNEMFGDGSANINNFPIVSLSELADEKLSYGSGASAVEFDGEVRYIRITDISDDGTLNIDKKSANVVEKKYLLKDGDILFARSGATVGKTYRYRNSDGIAMFAGYLIKFSPNTSLVNPDYIFHYTRTNFYRRFIEKSQTVVAQPNINAKQYGELSIPLPPLPLQEDFARFVEAVDKSKLAVKKSLEELETLKKKLMQDYFG